MASYRIPPASARSFCLFSFTARTWASALLCRSLRLRGEFPEEFIHHLLGCRFDEPGANGGDQTADLRVCVAMQFGLGALFHQLDAGGALDKSCPPLPLQAEGLGLPRPF